MYARIASVSALAFVLALGASAAVTQTIAEDGSGSSGSSIPAFARQVASEAELVEVFCHEAKWRGGEGVATVEAVHEVLIEKISPLTDLGIMIDLDGKMGSALALRGKLDAVCAAPDIATAQARVEEYKLAAYDVRDTLAGTLGPALRAEVETAVEAQRETLKAQFEDEIRQKVEERKDEIAQRLETQLRAEAERRKGEIQDRLQKEIEAELMEEYGGQENPDIPALMAIGESRGRARGAVEGEKVKAELDAKYRALAEEERPKLEAYAQELAEEKETEIRAAFGDFSGVQEDIAALAAEKQAEWDAHKALAAQAKAGIVKRVIEAYFDDAREKIEAERVALDSADADSRRRYSIPTTDELLAQLDRDEQDVVARFANLTNVTHEDVVAVQETFQEKWEGIRRKLESAKLGSASELIAKVDKNVNGGNWEAKFRKNLTHVQSLQKSYTKQADWCRKNPSAGVPGPKTTSNCAACRTITEFKAVSDHAAQIETTLNTALGLIGELDGHKAAATAGTADIVELVAYKDELTSTLTALQGMQKELGRLFEIRNTEARAEGAICKGN